MISWNYYEKKLIFIGKFTKSSTSSSKDECTPIKKGVGVFRTSAKTAGKSGMYTWAYLNGNISADRARHASDSREYALDLNRTLCSVITPHHKVTTFWIPEKTTYKIFENKNYYKKYIKLPINWKSKQTDVCVTGRVKLAGGWSAWRSPAPMLNLTWGPPGAGTWIQPKTFPTSVSRGTPMFST